MDKLTRAQKTALAYVQLVGLMPSRIRARTRSAVRDRCDFDAGADRAYTVRPEALAEIANHPLLRAARMLEQRGFSPRLGFFANRRNDGSRSVYFQKVLDDGTVTDAHAYRDGYWSVSYGRGGSGCA